MAEILDGRKVIGLYEEITLYGKKKKKKVIARIDTGATNNAIDTDLKEELGLGPIIKTKLVRSTHGSTVRPVLDIELSIAGEKLTAPFTAADRGHMKYQVLIGQNILKQSNFLIDPTKQGEKDVKTKQTKLK